MARLTVHDIPEAVHRALRARDDRHGRSMEAEVHEILAAAVATQGRMKLGSLLADIGRQAKLRDEEFAVFDRGRDKVASRRMDFE